MADIVVTNLNDSGVGSLRAALVIANANPDADVITFAVSGTITLTSGELTLTNDVTINGDTNGDHKADITISGNDTTRIFNQSGDGTDVNLQSLTLTNGNSGSSGGAITADGVNETLNIVDTTIQNSHSGDRGGAIFANYAATTITNSLVLNNSALKGGGLYVYGSAAITNTTVVGNTSLEVGGGIYIDGNMTVTNSTITNNMSNSDGIGNEQGGGIFKYQDTGEVLTITNTVFSDNFAGTVKDDLSNTDSLQIAVDHSAFGTTPLAITNNGGNLFNQTSTQINLGELLDNGGTTLTRSVLGGSVLIDAGTNTSLPADVNDIDGDGNVTELLPLDGRGAARVAGGTVDIGAVEQLLNQIINGTAADNLIFGGVGDDIINGFAGVDKITGGSGNDILTGGLGNDTFIFNASEITLGQADVITDFNADANNVGDTIALIGTNANSMSATTLASDVVLSYGDGVITDTITLNAPSSNPVRVNGYVDLAHAAANNLSGGFIFVTDASNEASHTWSSYLQKFSASGAIESTYTLNDDGSHNLKTFDNAGQSWFSIADAFNAGNFLTSKTTNFDDASRQVQYFDTAANSWSSLIDQYNASGQLYAETTNFDSGARHVRYIDQTNQIWSTVIDQFNDAGNLYAETTNYDSGGREVLYLDQTGASWTTILDQFNSAGNIYAETTIFDAGGRQAKYIDQTNQIWSTIDDIFDAQNRMTSEFTSFDDGTHSQIVFDVTNTHTWKQDVQIYDAAYNVTQHYQILYDNTIVYL